MGPRGRGNYGDCFSQMVQWEQFPKTMVRKETTACMTWEKNVTRERDTLPLRTSLGLGTITCIHAAHPVQASTGNTLPLGSSLTRWQQDTLHHLHKTKKWAMTASPHDTKRTILQTHFQINDSQPLYLPNRDAVRVCGIHPRVRPNILCRGSRFEKKNSPLKHM